VESTRDLTVDITCMLSISLFYEFSVLLLSLSLEDAACMWIIINAAPFVQVENIIEETA
jgi:hypothetical protein